MVPSSRRSCGGEKRALERLLKRGGSVAAVRFEGRYVHLYIRGKGRKERTLTLWKDVVEMPACLDGDPGRRTDSGGG